MASFDNLPTSRASGQCRVGRRQGIQSFRVPKCDCAIQFISSKNGGLFPLHEHSDVRGHLGKYRGSSLTNQTHASQLSAIARTSLLKVIEA